MFNIAVIGTGQIGSRHVQGISSMAPPCMLYMIDSQEASLRLATERICELPAARQMKQFSTHRQLTDLPERLDVAIVATNSGSRLQVLEELLAHCEVRSLILEKFLFQRELDYEVAAELFRRHRIDAWVNCPRRLYGIYQATRSFFENDPVQYLEVHGGAWGLGCNGIHFADLFEYLTGSLVDEYVTHELDEASYPSKRVGYVEFGGCITGRTENRRLRMTSIHGANTRLLMLIRGESKSCMIDEGAGRAWYFDQVEGWSEQEFVLPRQSEISGDVVSRILIQGQCDLPRYETAVGVHLPLLRAFMSHFRRFAASADMPAGRDACPIT